MQKPLGGHPLRFIILGFVLCDLVILGNYFTQKPLGGHPLRSDDFGICFYAKGGAPCDL